MKRVTARDETIISAIDFALGATEHRIGSDEDHKWLREQIESGQSEDKMKVAVEIGVALMRLVMDLRYGKDLPKHGR